MIYGNTSFLKQYSFLDQAILKCFEYAEINDLASFAPGSYEIEGDRLFVNIVSYETKNRDDRFWEAHKKYIDLHLMIHGKEGIDLNFIKNLEQKEFVEKDDFLPLEGEANSYVTLTDQDFLICYPDDGHRTAIKVGESTQIKKAIFKICLD